MAGMVKKIEYFVAVDEWMYLKPGIWLYHCGRRQQEYSTYNPRIPRSSRLYVSGVVSLQEKNEVIVEKIVLNFGNLKI